MRALASRSLTYERMQHAGSGCTSTGAIWRQTPIAFIRSTQTSIDRSKTCSNAIRLGVSQKVTKRTKAEFGVNADTWFPSFAAVNLFWFAAVAASLRRGAARGGVLLKARRQPPSRCFGVPGSAVATRSRNPEMVKAFARGQTPFQFALVLDTQGGSTSQIYGLFTTTWGAALFTSSW